MSVVVLVIWFLAGITAFLVWRERGEVDVVDKERGRGLLGMFGKFGEEWRVGGRSGGKEKVDVGGDKVVGVMGNREGKSEGDKETIDENEKVVNDTMSGDTTSENEDAQGEKRAMETEKQGDSTAPEKQSEDDKSSEEVDEKVVVDDLHGTDLKQDKREDEAKNAGNEGHAEEDLIDDDVDAPEKDEGASEDEGENPNYDGDVNQDAFSPTDDVSNRVKEGYLLHYVPIEEGLNSSEPLPLPKEERLTSDGAFEKLKQAARQGLNVTIDNRYTWLYDFEGYQSIVAKSDLSARVVNYTDGAAVAKCGKDNASVVSPPLAVFGPGFIDGTGRRVEIASGVSDEQTEVSGNVYEIAGGWGAHSPSHTERKEQQRITFMVPSIDVQPATEDNDVNEVVDAPVLMLAQHHGTTFFHVMNEVAPRFLAFYPLIMSHPEMKVGISMSQVLVNVLVALGLPESRIVQFEYSNFRLVKTAYFPPPLPHTTDQYYPSCAAESVVDVLRALHVLDASKLSSSSKKESIVLMQRARGYDADGKCLGKRCMANYDEVLKSIHSRFGDRYEIKEFKHSYGVIEGLKLFGDAHLKAIVGVHGAGFQNLAFVRRPGVVVLHISGKNHEEFYRAEAEKNGAKYIPLINEEVCHTCANIHVNVEELLKTLELNVQAA